ncbi:MAG: phenylalanine--tRNA ligase subunit beta, partial [Bacteriovoracaceae bacterium]
GVLSEGMLCSEVELGLGAGSSGIMELAEDAPVGQSMLENLGVEADIVLDVDNKSLTHRPDLWGHYGMAREFAAAYEKELKNPFSDDWAKKLESNFNSSKSPIAPKVEKDSSCLAYWGLSVDGVEVEESPLWMKNRLEAAGLRPINNIVDISNYVMLELGVPLHIFDRELIKDNVIHIKRVGKEESFTTLDEVERQLAPSDTVICDREKPLVLAGIMGGLNSGVSGDTSKIFIEVANWQADEVRTTSTRLGLRSDSSQRYEKSLDSLQCHRTLLRTLELILSLCPGAKVVGKPEYDGKNLEDTKQLKIATSREKIERVLGYEVGQERLESIFKSLDFGIEKNAAELLVSIPTYRTTKDIENEADLVEEVGRMIGYDNINPVAPLTELTATKFEPAKKLSRKAQDFLSLKGEALEVITYPLVGKKLLEKADWPTLNEELVLVNALSKDADRMRPSLVPSALNVVAENAKRFERFSFFEMGRSYLPDEKNFAQEHHQLLIGVFNKKQTPFLELINKTEKLLNYLNIPFEFCADTGKFKNEALDKNWSGVHPHEYLNARVMGKFKGVLASVHPLTLKSFKAKGFFSFAVMDLTDFMGREMKDRDKYHPISKFPVSTFDCTVLVNKAKPAASVLEALKRVKLKELTDKRIVDVFDLSATENAVTISVTFEDPNRTLDHDFVKNAETKVVETLQDSGYPLKS